MIDNGIVYLFMLLCGGQNCICRFRRLGLCLTGSRNGQTPYKTAGDYKKGYILKYFHKAIIRIG